MLVADKLQTSKSWSCLGGFYYFDRIINKHEFERYHRFTVERGELTSATMDDVGVTPRNRVEPRRGGWSQKEPAVEFVNMAMSSFSLGRKKRALRKGGGMGWLLCVRGQGLELGSEGYIGIFTLNN